MENNKEISVNPKEFGLNEVEGINIQRAFMPKIVEREALKTLYERLITKELSDVLSFEAGQLRKQLVKVRTGISEVHKTQKAFFLAGGRFADTIKNKETLPIEQMEEKLWEIEKWAQIQEEKRIESLKNERIEILKQYEVDGSLMAVGCMTDDIWFNYLSGVKMNYEAKKAAEAKDIADAKALEELQAKEREAQRLENIKLKEEAEKSEAILKAEREAALLAQSKADAEAKKAKEESDKAIAKAKAEADKLAAELKAKADAETKVEADRIKAEEIKKAEARKLAKAPDKEKLNKWIDDLMIGITPQVGADAHKLALNIHVKFQGFSKWAKEEISKL